VSDIKPKHALCFAHRGEAKAFIKRWKLKGSPAKELYGVWRSADQQQVQQQVPPVWIVGEGIETAGIRLAFLLGRHPEIKTVLNLGVAGALKAGLIPGSRKAKRKNLDVGDLVQVRTSYAIDYQQKIRFKTYTSATDQDLYQPIDCISVGARLKTASECSYASNFAGLIDMELWGLHAAAQASSVHLEAIKVVSDCIEPGEAPPEELCMRVRSQTDILSESLFEAWTKWQIAKPGPSFDQDSCIDFLSKLDAWFPQTFWLSRYQKNDLSKSLDAIAISKEISQAQLAGKILDWVAAGDIAEIKGPAKKRGSILAGKIKSLVYAPGDHS